MDKFIPDMYQKSIYTINYKKLKKMKVKCLVFDLDNTIATYKEDVPSKEVKELFHILGNDFKIIIMSNSNKKRLRPFKEILNVDVAFSSHKPFKKKYKKIMRLYNYKPEEMAFIGDQLLTDILGANNIGAITILVNSMSTLEPIWTKCNRVIEKIIYKRFRRKEILVKGVYYE